MTAREDPVSPFLTSRFCLGARKVNQLDLSAYADELERQGEGKRAMQLDSIVEEIRYPYRCGGLLDVGSFLSRGASSSRHFNALEVVKSIQALARCHCCQQAPMRSLSNIHGLL